MATRMLLLFARPRRRRWLPAGLGVLLLGGVTLTLIGPHAGWGQAQDGTTPVISTDRAEVVRAAVDLAHAGCYQDDPFPSAKKCQQCHEDHFREWSASQHAYAQLSPVFNTFSNKLLKLTSGTNGDFCIRCHTPVGMALHEPLNISQMDRPPTSREGVTCVVCHRINQPWGKMSGRQARAARRNVSAVSP